MKYIKTYENASKEPKKGDYVICNEPDNNDNTMNNFLSQNIGMIIKYGTSKYKYTVKFDDVPNILLSYFGSEEQYQLCRSFTKNEIIHWSRNKEELMKYVTANKYNL